MRVLIATVMAILGTLLVLGGAGAVLSRAWSGNSADPADATVPSGITTKPGAAARILGIAQRVQGADRLIAWGIVLLVLAAVAAGTIGFSLNADAGSVK